MQLIINKFLVGNKFRKIKGDNTDTFKINEKDLPKVSDSHKILSHMKVIYNNNN